MPNHIFIVIFRMDKNTFFYVDYRVAELFNCFKNQQAKLKINLTKSQREIQHRPCLISVKQL